jgi:hypothetical protein
MAKNIALFFSGTIGPVVICKRNGKYYAREKRNRIAQTPATKRCGGNFGKASGMGKILRPLLEPVLPFPKDQVMQRSFSGAINSWFSSNDIGSLSPQTSLPFLNAFSFNTATSIQERWKLPMEVTQPSGDLLQLLIPSFVPIQTITAPAGTARILCTVITASCGLNTVSGDACRPVNFTIPYTNDIVPEQIIPLPVYAGNGCLVLTVMRLNFQYADGRLESRPAFMPSSVIDARFC